MALYVGVVIYLVGHVGFKRRTMHRWSVSRVITAALLVIAVPLVHGVPALAQIAVVTAVLAALVVFESFHFAGERAELHHSDSQARESPRRR